MQACKVSPPIIQNYVFNRAIGIDVFDIHVAEGQCYLFLNIVCLDTDLQIVANVRQCVLGNAA